MSDFTMPSLGADMESGRLVQWLVKPGSVVKKGDVVAVVETHKGAFEIEIFEEGVVSELCAKEGEELPVGAPLARLTRPGEQSVPKAPKAAPEAIPVSVPLAVEVGRAPGTQAAPLASFVQPSSRPRASPAARRRAGELGIDLNTLKGTGFDGSVTLADVELAAAGGAPPKDPSSAAAPATRRRGFDPNEMRLAIAAAMSRSKREIPHYYLASTIDMSRPLAWLESFNRQRKPEERLLPAALLLKATALALREYPQLNGFWEDGRFRPADGVHIGWAISLRGGGLIAPAIHEVDKHSLQSLMGALRDLVGRARSGGIRGSEMMDPTFTVTSVGDRGAESVLGVIYPPQVAIMGFGRVIERPWIVDGQVTARSLIIASLAADHRASDGHLGGLFLSAVDRFLQEPEGL
ncbi:MAG: biotin/lipoyl-binding protein [Mesorhizobium sp.]|uniref:dihydrolipoamide acetyltransferase family protein n=2 Tax=Mesorhizobium sp. TaxID=1871066 RepID=UPI000FE2DA76|nr:dihydrolipoamide acetyltransferase family protein [Mesorhizobium sp.]RWH72857.1 MAG: 2-oxo acid dehydrogenase subunit E2 [Mesorhizobium sp.]RWL34257.1 MAG: 2-oxo acid dehydrogenase subunit E2 [Mesorhizobium sp.]RWL35673.1 MAG: 2-oxo acid dehydrogenase subunit E2 [Mesorhizobium sp.]RWL41083.1 MAG: 2-oxo acid dehydrogenase subunit E2 [Mesorhizobium sp.]RWL53188.1 MAG: 2-oxo acid dehydrogenase subunit E2 [Mesorhizobium sp.]